MPEYYMIAQTHGVDPGILNIFNPQPRGDLAGAVERSYSATPGFYEQGLFTTWYFDHFDSEAQYNDLLAVFGLDDLDVAPVTIRTRSQRGIWGYYDAWVHLPEPNVEIKQSNFFLRTVEFRFTDMELHV